MPAPKKQVKKSQLACPFCDADIAEAAFPFCEACRQQVTYCPKCKQSVPGGHPKCPHCGAEIKGDT